MIKLDDIKKLKKVELHLHLDGSVSPEIASDISGLPLDEVKKMMYAKDKCSNLSEYLTKFDFPISLMQAKENLTIITKDLIKRLEDQEVFYTEIRFAPMFHVKEGLTYEEVVKTVIEASRESNIKVNFILCMMRGAKFSDNLKTIEVAEKYLNKGVCALDLAGDEIKYPLADYLELFKIAKTKNIPFTIHAGETSNAGEVRQAILIGAKRIGHGIKAIFDDEVLDLIRKKDVLLEVCPTSNVQTNVVFDYSDHPIYDLYKRGVIINISTDNNTVSHISLTEEYLKIFEHFNFTIADINNITVNSIKHSFLSDKEKKMYLDRFIKEVGEYSSKEI